MALAEYTIELPCPWGQRLTDSAYDWLAADQARRRAEDAALTACWLDYVHHDLSPSGHEWASNDTPKDCEP